MLTDEIQISPAGILDTSEDLPQKVDLLVLVPAFPPGGGGALDSKAPVASWGQCKAQPERAQDTFSVSL